MVKKMIKLFKNEEGVTAIEYALIAALVGIVLVGGATALGLNINALFVQVADKVAGS